MSARLSLPPTDELMPGLWMVPVPIPVSPLRYVLVYVFETNDGLVLVDSGWDTPEAWDGLNDGFSTIGAATQDVRGVLVTHIHPDHYGLAGRLRSETGCWIGLHPADAALIDSRYVDVDDLIQRTRGSMLDGGVPPDAVEELATASLRVREFVSMADPDMPIEDGDRPPVGDWDLVALHTPGHTPGHLCFALPEQGAVLTGDHVLPRITPNVSFHAQSGDDPLGDFLGSLEGLRTYRDTTGLPGHEWPFSNLSNRIDELIAHHEDRMREAEQLVSNGAETAWEVAEAIGWSRPWQRLEPFMRRMAVAEIHAHLILLERRGRIEKLSEMPSRWRPHDVASDC